MDTITYYIIIEAYFASFFAIIVSIYFLIKIYKKESIFKLERALGPIRTAMINNPKKFNNISSILMFLWILVTSIWLVKPILDLPNVIANKYITTECITMEENYVDKNDRSLYCKNDNKEIYISYRGPDVPKNTRIKINYFKHLEIGRIIAIESKESAEDMN